MTGPTMLVPKASDSGAWPRWISSLKITSWIGFQPVPPHSLGQCGTDQPCWARMRVQVTMSSLPGWRPHASLSRMLAGRFLATKSLTSSRNASSSALKPRSIVASPISGFVHSGTIFPTKSRAGQPGPSREFGVAERDRVGLEVLDAIIGLRRHNLRADDAELRPVCNERGIGERLEQAFAHRVPRRRFERGARDERQAGCGRGAPRSSRLARPVRACPLRAVRS